MRGLPLGGGLHGGECAPVLHRPEDHVPQLRGGLSLVLLRTQPGLVRQAVEEPVGQERNINYLHSHFLFNLALLLTAIIHPNQHNLNSFESS